MGNVSTPSARQVLRYGFVIATDAVACALAVYVALFLRFGGDIPHGRSLGFFQAAPFLLVISLLIFSTGGLYTRAWRYFGLTDLVQLMKLVTASSIASFTTLWVLDKIDWMPLSIPIIYWMVATFFLAGTRIVRRTMRRRRLAQSNARIACPGVGERRSPKLTLVVGDLDWAESIIEPLARSHGHAFRPVGLLDHSGLDVRLRVHGVPVLGTLESFAQVVEKLALSGNRPQAVMVNAVDPTLKGRAMVSLVSEAERLGLEVAKISDRKVLEPGADGKISLEFVNLSDLLGRPELQLDSGVVERAVAGRRVMVTGAGGTIGSELVRQLARFGPSEIQLLDCGEYNLYAIDMELGENFPDIPRHRILCSIRQRESVFLAFKEHRPELVFHAAALKHVPLVEENPCSGAQTNVLGTRNIADATREYGALAMVQVSTDKAVNPVGLMGATKRLGELYCQALDLAGAGNPNAPRFMTVRFGNVLGSSGSLIPLFQRQLSRGGPLTVTDPRIERFFMTVHEAVQLVLHSSAQALSTKADRGKIFVLDMGEPVKIDDLARRMIRLAGLTPDVHVKIEYVGLRLGEKLFEELFDEDEERLASSLTGIFLARPNAIPLSILSKRFDEIGREAAEGNAERVRQLVHKLVAYRPQNEPGFPAEAGDQGLIVQPPMAPVPAPAPAPAMADMRTAPRAAAGAA
jgi:FlaA1/EpsC-like NDP-sugar epimerase